MTHITDADRTIFSEAHNTVLQFTDEQHERLHKIAQDLKAVLDEAKKGLKKEPIAFDPGAFGSGFQTGS